MYQVNMIVQKKHVNKSQPRDMFTEINMVAYLLLLVQPPQGHL